MLHRTNCETSTSCSIYVWEIIDIESMEKGATNMLAYSCREDVVFRGLMMVKLVTIWGIVPTRLQCGFSIDKYGGLLILKLYFKYILY